MNRRNFLQVGTAGLAGTTLGAWAAQAESRPHKYKPEDPAGAVTPELEIKSYPQKQDPSGSRAAANPSTLKKGYMLGTFPDRQRYTLMEQFRMLQRAGFDGAEPASGLDRQDVLRAQQATGLEIPSVVVSTHWSHPLTHPDPQVRSAGQEGLKTALQDARAYGSKCVLLVPGVVNAEVSYDQAYERSQAAIRQSLPMAEDLGVVIAVENVWNHFLLSPMEAARYIDELESPFAKWYFDAGNIMNFGWEPQWIRILGDRIAMIHIKEFSRTKRNEEGLWRGFRVNLTEGDNDWPGTMKALRETGYGGYGIAEPAYRDPSIPHEAWLRDYVAHRMDHIFSL